MRPPKADPLPYRSFSSSAISMDLTEESGADGDEVDPCFSHVPDDVQSHAARGLDERSPAIASVAAFIIFISMLSSSMISALASAAASASSTLWPNSTLSMRGEFCCMRDTTSLSGIPWRSVWPVIVLDQNAVSQVQPMIQSSTYPHPRICHDSQPRGGLASVGDTDRQAAHCLNIAPSPWRYRSSSARN